MLQMTLDLEKDSYAADEPVPGKIRLVNAGVDSVVVNSRLAINSPFAPEEYCDLSFTVTNPEGKEEFFGSRINIGEPESRHFRELAPGETLERSFNLRGFYRLKAPGAYSAQATYQNVSEPGDERTAWKGEVRSNTTSFTVQA